MNVDEKLMLRCLELAQNGMGRVAPNPLVGAVLVYQEKIIGEGWHQEYGSAHAEINCFNSVKENNRKLIAESTLYVNLEPCNHFGKTPPCTLAIIKNGIKKVVIGSTDSNKIVAGSGIQRLRENNIEVVENVLQEKCAELNRRFFTFHTQKRPYVILKIAQSNDAFMAPEGKQQQWLSNEFSKRLSHRWRSEEQAILIGKNTALIDNPQLTARLWKGKNPMRILIDKNNEVPTSNHLFNQAASTLIFNANKNFEAGNIHYQKISFSQNVVQQILNALFEKNIQSLIVEGGAITAQSFLEAGLVDEIRLITTPHFLRSGKKTPSFSADLKEQFYLGKDLIQIFTTTKR